PRDFLLWIKEHLLPLRKPAGGARNRKENREHGHREAHGLINEASIKIHVGIELALDEVFVFESDAFAFERDFKKRIFSHEIEDFVGDTLDNAGTRVVILVDAVAETHEFYFTRFDALDELGNLTDRADFVKHSDDFFVGASVERAV